ncbi:universal stress protein [Hymenobacter rubripertinctus]|uniref:Universal stress protein n=1 Tax=Hymenobacter rubripertinctus TaxID=2029981 RepID=A0A418QJR8_9BACT|nr:universal stress protein [Hymenobacter rubripertinctus]RIY05437.1 universal stress protein [Hymenobacter rubripertinctus]
MASSLLVLTDFAQPANQALAYADRLAAAIGAQLVLLHVSRDALPDPEQLGGPLLDLGTEATDLAFASLLSGLTAPAEAEIGHGPVAEAVAQAVRQHQPTLIVLSRTDAGDTPDKQLMPLSVALLHRVPHPLLMVPESPVPLPVPHRVLLALDKEAFTLGQYAGAMRGLLDALAAAVTVLHVLLPCHVNQHAAQALEAVRRTGLIADVAEPVLHRHVSAMHPAEGILRIIGTAEYDLVALVARPRSFLGRLFHRSVTAQVLLHSPIPVLILPALE